MKLLDIILDTLVQMAIEMDIILWNVSHKIQLIDMHGKAGVNLLLIMRFCVTKGWICMR